jgi:hypothetical protein
VSVLYELKLRPEAPANATLALLRLRWRPAEGTEFREIEQPLGRAAVAKRWEGASRGFRLATVVGRFAEVLPRLLLGQAGAQRRRRPRRARAPRRRGERGLAAPGPRGRGGQFDRPRPRVMAPALGMQGGRQVG